MKKNINLVILIAFLFSGIQAYSAGTCPTPAQVQTKEKAFQIRAINSMNNNNNNPNEILDLVKEQEKYHDNLYYGCLQYLKTNPNPECDRLNTITTGYMFLPKEKQTQAKAELNAIKNKLSGKCSVETKIIEATIK